MEIKSKPSHTFQQNKKASTDLSISWPLVGNCEATALCSSLAPHFYCLLVWLRCTLTKTVSTKEQTVGQLNWNTLSLFYQTLTSIPTISWPYLLNANHVKNMIHAEKVATGPFWLRVTIQVRGWGVYGITNATTHMHPSPNSTADQKKLKQVAVQIHLQELEEFWQKKKKMI